MTITDELRRLLLISNSTLHGSGYLDHAEKRDSRLCWGQDQGHLYSICCPRLESVWGQGARRFRDMGLALTVRHDVYNKRRAIAEADVIFVGGGNTFRLLEALL